MFKSIFFAAASVAVASAQMANIMDLLILDELSHTGYYYGGHSGIHDLLPLLALGGLGAGAFPGQPGGTIMLEEYLLWQDLMHGTHSHGGPRGMDDVLPLVLLGMNDGKSTFDSMMAIHELEIAHNYDDMWGMDGLLTIASLQDAELNGFLHDFHVVQGVRDQRYNGNSADLLPLAFLTSNDPDVQMENLHQFHYLQNWGNDHNDILPWMVLGGESFNTVEPIVPFWALDQIINGDEYHYDPHYGHGHGHGAHHGAHHGPVHHAPVVHRAPVHRPVYGGYSRHAPVYGHGHVRTPYTAATVPAATVATPAAVVTPSN